MAVDQALSENIKKTAEALASAKKVTILSGAGVSKESGIPTFRDAQTGLWAKFDPMQLATREGFSKDPSLVWKWYDYRRKLLQEAKPNPAHHAIAELEKLVSKVIVVTQNIDSLHQKAGSTDVIELHGNISTFKCFNSDHPRKEEVEFELQAPPECFCGSMIRPSVVWFGEALPAEAMARGFSEAQDSDVILVVGTSALVQPAASIPYGAKAEAVIVDVNPEENPITDISSIVLRERAGAVLPLVVTELRRIV